MSSSKESTDNPHDAQQQKRSSWGLIIVPLVLLLFLAYQGGWLRLPTLPSLGADASLWLIFLTGLTAGGLSCVAVQGGLLATTIARREQLLLEEKLVLTEDGSQTTGHATPILLFLGAKLVAYTLLGALLGLFGSWISLSPAMRGGLQILIGLFMLGMALQMLDVHPIFRYLVIQPPKRIQRFIRQSSKADDAFTPLFLGALTVFIPCGVTQAMELLALGSGSATRGALIMFAFVLGTSPIFYLLGLATARLSSAWEGTFMRAAAIAILVMALYSMLAGSRLLGYQIGLGNPIEVADSGDSSDSIIRATPIALLDDGATQMTGLAARNLPQINSDGYQEVKIAALNSGYEPTLLRLRAGVPARITLVTNETYSCARAFVIPALGVERVLSETGDETIELMPQEVGSIPFTCSMGMYTGVIEVVANDEPPTQLANQAPAAIEETANQATEQEPVQDSTQESALDDAKAVRERIILTASDQDRMQIFMMSPDGYEKLTDGPTENFHPTISPDGSWVAYTSRHESNLNIQLMSIDSRIVKPLSTGSRTEHASRDYQPTFSPDGSQIAFISDRDGDPDIWLMNVDGSDPRQLLNRASDQHLGGWHPDGQSLLFVDHNHEQNTFAIWKMNLTDGTLAQLTHQASINDAPVFSPDGQRIAFYSDRAGGLNLFTMAADGSDIQQLTKGEEQLIMPTYSPDGKWIIYGSPQWQGILKIPSTGGHATILAADIQGLPAGWVTVAGN